MARITFKSKVRGNILPIPTLKRSYCDLAAFRDHKVYGVVANSDLFLNALARIRRDVIGRDGREGWIPGNVTVETVETAGFLATSRSRRSRRSRRPDSRQRHGRHGRIPGNVTVDTAGFLALVTIDV
jgi:hypothetical protein